MMVCRLIPVGSVPGLTEVGTQIIGIFIGTIYLWTTVDATLASLTSILMIALSDYAPAAGVLSTCFGNATVIQMLFMMIFMGGLTHRKVTDYIARFLITRRSMEGRPWVFTFVILFSSFLLSVFVNVFTPVFLFWPVLYRVFEDVGYKKEDKYPKLLIMAVGLVCLVGFPVPPYTGNALALIGNYSGMVGNFENLAVMENIRISNGPYFVSCFLTGLVLILGIIVVMRLLFRPDVTPMRKISVDIINKNPLPPMNQTQKTYSVLLVMFIVLMLVPSMLPQVPVLSFFKANSLALALALVVIACLIQCDGEPILHFRHVIGNEFAWPSFWLCASAILLGGVLTNEATGVTTFLTTVLSPIFSGMGERMFVVLFCIIAVVLTNFCNSLVIGMVLQPVALTYCNMNGVNPVPVIILLSISVLSTAICTPAANPIAAMIFSNKEYFSSKKSYLYSFLFALSETILIVAVGVPLVYLFN